jgi:Bacterial toxin 4
LIGRARRIQANANQIAETSTEALNANRQGLLNQTSQLEGEIAALERGVRRENELSDRIGRDEARLKYGDGALDYDTKYYRWVRKPDGTLEFQRRSLAVPWREFNPQTGKFEITRSLFEPVDPGRLKQLRETSLTKDFAIAATVDNLADLRHLRPASAYVKPHPGNWVLVRINDDNLVQFITEPVAHGVIFEFPDGSRVWRTPQNTIATEGALRGSIGRRGFEQTMHPQLRTDVEGRSNEGIPAGEATGVEHERAHPRGQGTGFELMNHIPLAPTYVNQELQARGIELFMRELKRIHPGVDFRLSTEHSVFPGTLRQARIDYHIDVVTPNGRRPLTVIRIGTDYSDPLRPAEVEMRWLTKNEADLALMDEVDMPAALQALEERIEAARSSRSKR